MEFWGLIDERNVELAERLQIHDYLNVDKYLPKSESVKRLARCDALFLPLESSGTGEPLFIPGKLFEYLNSRKPVLALCEKASDAGQILVNAGSAVLCEPRNVSGIADQLEELVTNPGVVSGLKVDEGYMAQFRWEAITARMASVYKKCLNEPG